MKTKTIIPIIAGIIVATALSFAFSLESQTSIEANIEALAEGESSIFGPMCTKVKNPGPYYLKACDDCNGDFGKYAMDTVAYCRK